MSLGIVFDAYSDLADLMPPDANPLPDPVTRLLLTLILKGMDNMATKVDVSKLTAAADAIKAEEADLRTRVAADKAAMAQTISSLTDKVSTLQASLAGEEIDKAALQTQADAMAAELATVATDMQSVDPAAPVTPPVVPVVVPDPVPAATVASDPAAPVAAGSAVPVATDPSTSDVPSAPATPVAIVPPVAADPNAPPVATAPATPAPVTLPAPGTPAAPAPSDPAASASSVVTADPANPVVAADPVAPVVVPTGTVSAS